MTANAARNGQGGWVEQEHWRDGKQNRCVLAEALQGHGIDATALEPFVIAEIGGMPNVGTEQTEFVVTLENVGQSGTRTEQLFIEWQGSKAL